jgi:hypothetical protein
MKPDKRQLIVKNVFYTPSEEQEIDFPPPLVQSDEWLRYALN